MHIGGFTFFLHHEIFSKHIIHLLWEKWSSMVVGGCPNCLGTWESHPCHWRNIIVRFNSYVHQEQMELYVGWGNHIDFQFFIENFQFSVQWYDSHIMNIISYDNKFLWWILMFGYLQLRKWDPGINWLDKLCGKAFSLKGVQCKQWDPGIVCFWRNFIC